MSNKLHQMMEQLRKEEADASRTSVRVKSTQFTRLPLQTSGDSAVSGIESEVESQANPMRMGTVGGDAGGDSGKRMGLAGEIRNSEL